MQPIPHLKYQDTSLDLVYKYKGGQINFRSFLIVNEAEILPSYFFLGSSVAQRCVLFGFLARDANGVPLYPRRFGIENEHEDAEIKDEYGTQNGLLINQIATKVKLLERINRQLKAFNYIVAGDKEDDEEDDGKILSLGELKQDVARTLGYTPTEIGFWDLMDFGGILSSYRRQAEAYKSPKRGVIRDYRTKDERKPTRRV